MLCVVDVLGRNRKIPGPCSAFRAFPVKCYARLVALCAHIDKFSMACTWHCGVVVA